MSTNGNALAGCLGASLQAIEVAKLISGNRAGSAVGSELLFDAASHAFVASRLESNPDCRFAHERWEIATAGEGLTLRDALSPGGAGARIFVPGSAFVSKLVCSACVRAEESWRLRESLDEGSLRCPSCDGLRSVCGFDLVERVAATWVPPALLDRRLEALGLRAGEVFGIAAEQGATRYLVLGTGTAAELRAAAEPFGATVVVAGLGNIGSFLAPLLARLPGVARLLLCDPDFYDENQVVGQDIEASAAGRGKAAIQAERLRRIRPELRVEAFASPVEQLPLGRLIGAIVVSCLDSRAARLRLAARAWNVGSPFVDAAVGGGASLLTRTSVYRPDPGAACFECSFDERDYAALEQVLPCAGSAAERAAA